MYTQEDILANKNFLPILKKELNGIFYFILKFNVKR